MIFFTQQIRSKQRTATLILLFLFIIDASYARTEAQSESTQAIPVSRDKLISFNPVIEKILPSTIRVDVQKRSVNRSVSGLSVSRRNPQTDQRFSLQKMSSGAGVIISPDGYIITNSHLIRDAIKIDVTLYDGRRFTAQIVGADNLTEVAAIKIDATDLPYLRLGNSESCKIGDWVLAVGNPLNLKFTVTSGIISALGREVDIINSSYAVEAFIQTDAAINPGNSGGPLINLAGEIIGINTAIATETGLNMGFGFAVPANLVRTVLRDLIQSGRVERAYLGAAFLDVNADIAAALDMSEIQGVFVDDVFIGSPAQKFGLTPADVVLSINGTKLNRANQLQVFIAKEKPGNSIWIELLRDGEIHNIQVTLGELSEDRGLTDSQPGNTQFRYFGLRVREITAEDEFDLELKNNEGVIITKVQKFSPAARAGLRIDDVIIAVDRSTIKNAETFYQQISKFQNKILMLAVKRSDQRYHFFLRNPKYSSK